MQRFDSKTPAELAVLTFDFRKALVSGETLSGTPTVTVTVSVGVDGSPTDILNGDAQIDASGKKVLVAVKEGLDGCEYEIRVLVETTNVAKVPELPAILPVVEDP